MGAILKREFKSYFHSPIGYVFLAIIYFFGNMYFTDILRQSSGQIQFVFQGMFNIIMIVIPFITMRLFSEEKRQKTDQLLFTSPVSISGIVVGKYLAALLMFLVGIAITLVHIVIIATFTVPNWNIFLGNFLAIALLGSALIAIGIFISSLTESQMVAAIGTYAIIMLIYLFDTIAAALNNVPFFAQIFLALSFNTRYSDFVQGILNVSHILYFLSFIVVFLFLTVRVLEKKRWS